MVRLSEAGIGVNVPTLDVTTVTGALNPPAPRPLKSVATLIGHGPFWLPVQWVPEIVTRPSLPIAISPNWPTVAVCAAVNAPIRPSPVTWAPRADMVAPLLEPNAQTLFWPVPSGPTATPG